MSRAPVFRLSFDRRELIVDSFAGGGGASLGIEWALGRSPDIAINHDAEAIAVHAANHPGTRHFREDVWRVDPMTATKGRPVGLMWLSPDCKHFSKAKGGTPVEKRIRGLAWVAVHWAKTVKPRVIVLENVEEFADWGPIGPDGRPDPLRRGRTFRQFVGRLRGLGYDVDWQQMVACEYGAPTSRRRLFLVARCDGQPIVWPAPTHGEGLTPFRTAAECIDWSLPCPSIFERQRPLAANTMRRVAAGIQRFVVGSAQPFIVPLRGTSLSHGNVHALHAPLATVSAQGTHHALVAAFLAKNYGGPNGHFVVGQDLRQTIGTVTAQDHHSLVCAVLVKFYSEGGQWARCDQPMHTIPTKDRMGLVTVGVEQYRIVDIGLRMLQPRELARAHAFPDSYILEHGAYGESITKTAQVRLIGNSVVPLNARAIVRANLIGDVELARRVA